MPKTQNRRRRRAQAQWPVALTAAIIGLQLGYALHDAFRAPRPDARWAAQVIDQGSSDSSADASSEASSEQSSAAQSSSSSMPSSVPSAVVTFCGNGIAEPGEDCDPPNGNTCTDACKFDPNGGVKSSSSSSRPAPAPTCGNAVRDPGEECDNGRLNGLSPTCDANCRIKYCGNGVVERERGEECDSGSADVPQCGGRVCMKPTCPGGPATCAGGCRWVFAPACPVPQPQPEPPPASSSAPSDTVVIADPQSSQSSSEKQIVIILPPRQSSSSSSSSAESDTVVILPDASSSEAHAAPPDEASSASASSGDAGSVAGADTTIEWPASEPGSSSASPCGNGLLDADEQCDDGNDNDADGCSNACAAQNVLPFCGDGMTQPDLLEECDDGAANADDLPNACRSSCRRARCGDRIVDAGEQCDDGNENETDGCTSSCVADHCGDGRKQESEECDDGPLNGDRPDLCRLICRKPACGDAIIDAGELCDDGAENGQQGKCRANCTEPRCGDGLRDPGEGCDDGNLRDYDSCSAQCTIEAACLNNDCVPDAPRTLLHLLIGLESAFALLFALRTRYTRELVMRHA